MSARASYKKGHVQIQHTSNVEVMNNTKSHNNCITHKGRMGRGLWTVQVVQNPMIDPSALKIWWRLLVWIAGIRSTVEKMLIKLIG